MTDVTPASQAPGVAPSARLVIIRALDQLEEENERLHEESARVQSEVERLRRENEELRRQLEQLRSDRKQLDESYAQITREYDVIKVEYDRCNEVMAEEGRRFKKLESEHASHCRQLQQATLQVADKDRDLQAALRQLEKLTLQLEQTSRKNFNERDIELMHAIEVMKDEKRGLVHEQQELGRAHKTLQTETDQLQAQLALRVAELKNESRRHGLLTKEFNSLLEENNQLKIQLRGRLASRGGSRSERPAEPAADSPSTLSSLSGRTRQFSLPSREQEQSARDRPQQRRHMPLSRANQATATSVRAASEQDVLNEGDGEWSSSQGGALPAIQSSATSRKTS